MEEGAVAVGGLQFRGLWLVISPAGPTAEDKFCVLKGSDGA